MSNKAGTKNNLLPEYTLFLTNIIIYLILWGILCPVSNCRFYFPDIFHAVPLLFYVPFSVQLIIITMILTVFATPAPVCAGEPKFPFSFTGWVILGTFFTLFLVFYTVFRVIFPLENATATSSEEETDDGCRAWCVPRVRSSKNGFPHKNAASSASSSAATAAPSYILSLFEFFLYLYAFASIHTLTIYGVPELGPIPSPFFILIGFVFFYSTDQRVPRIQDDVYSTGLLICISVAILWSLIAMIYSITTTAPCEYFSTPQYAKRLGEFGMIIMSSFIVAIHIIKR